ncbi:CHAT domain-containing protein [Streptomyces sp. NPDC047981]|uniref:CHAT domain-containing protein n=1 Tax=Streptomyces sp. NPDC047981 TaxID=3154610 RepID=UPI003438DF15
MTTDVEETARRILDHVQRAEHDAEALAWFLTEEAAADAEAVRRAGRLPDGHVLLAALNAIGYYDFGRFLAGGETDLAALGSAVVCFFDVYRASPAHVPPLLTPLLALLAGEPAGADADPGGAYEAGAGVLLLYTAHRNPVLLPAAAGLLRHAVAGFPEGSAEQGTCLSDLGLVLLYGFRDGGGPELLDEAMLLSRASAAAPSPARAEQARRQGNLGLVLRHAADASSDPDTTRESVETLRRTLRVSLPGDPYHALHLGLLGSALLSAAPRLDEPALLVEALDLLRRSVAAEPPGHPPPAAHLADLGMAAITLSLAPERATGPQDRARLHDEGLDAIRRAAATSGNPVEASLHLANLAFALNARTVNTRNPAALDDAHRAARDALATAPQGHPVRAYAEYILSEVLRTRYVETGDLDELDSALGHARSALAVTAPHDAPFAVRAVDLADLLRLRANAAGDAPDLLAEALALLRRVTADTPTDPRGRARALLILARVLDTSDDGTGERAATHAAEAERTYRECLALTVGNDGVGAAARHAFGQLLLRRANRATAYGEPTGPAADTAARTATGPAADTATSPAADTPAARAEEARREGLALIHEALDLMGEDDPRRSEYLSELGCVHLELAETTGSPEACAEAVAALRRAVAAAGSGHDRAVAGSNLGAALVWLGLLTAQEAPLAEGVRAHREAVAATGARDHYRAHRLGNLGDALQRLAQHRSDVTLVEEAVEVLREAVRDAGPGAPGAADNFTRLGNALRSITRFTGDPAPLEEALHWQRQAVAAAGAPAPRTAGTHEASVSRARVNLANVLIELYQRSLDESQREEALSQYREALAHTREPGERHVVLTNYGNALFWLAGDTVDDVLMDRAIGVLREATAVVPASHAGRSGVLMNLGLALVRRSRLTGDRTWLAEGLTVLRRAVDESAPSSFDRSVQLSNLAHALSFRFDVTGDRADADEAADLLREAISLEHGERHGRDLARINLGVLLHRIAFSPVEAEPDLVLEARRVLEEALAGLDERHPRRPMALLNLAGTIMATAELAEDAGDPTLGPLLDRGLSAVREALGRLSDGHPDHTQGLWILARTQVARARFAGVPDTRTGVDGGARTGAAGDTLTGAAGGAGTGVDGGTRTGADGGADARRAAWAAPLGEAIRCARQAAHTTVASVSKRLLAARTWGDAAAAAGEDAEALAGYAYAVGLLARLAPRGLARADQEGRLIVGTGLASDAAAFALRVGDPSAALSLLEQGRGILLAQGVESRGDLSRLRTADPALAAEFERVRDALSTDPHGGLRTVPADPRPPGAPFGPPDGPAYGPSSSGPEAGLLAESRHALARAWDELLDRIRRLPGFDDFLATPTAAELLGAAAKGPVVVVNVSRHGSAALLVTADEGVQVVPLPALSPEEALSRATEFVGAVDHAYGDQGARRAVAAMRTLSDTLEWLWTAVAEPVLDRLGPRAAPREDGPSTRLWWCPTGWLSFLPLHAAGRPDPRPGETVMDRVVSSYTPTLRALVRARNAPAGTAVTLPAPLIVTLADTPGAPSLPGVAQEARLLRRLFPAHRELAGGAATVAAVRDALPAHPWVHFSCHGVNDPHTPSASGLVLHDGRLTVRDAAEQRPREAVLAVLSACSTSQGGFTLPDESVHLASSFQLAGYPHVIGTLWPVADKVATRLTEELYTSLVDDLARGRPIDPATALHRPVRELRRRLAGAPHLWAAHIHTGP